MCESDSGFCSRLKVNTRPIERLLVVGDGVGIPEVLSRVPYELVVAIVAAEIRPQYHEKLQSISKEIGVPFLVQPKSYSDAYHHFILDLKQLAPESLICHSYSMLIRKEVLQLVNGRAFNIHMSLLPRNRGPNPIQWAIINGDIVTGVTLHMMDAEFDSGAIVDQEEVKILDSDTWDTLLNRARKAQEILLSRAIPCLLEGNWEAISQDEARANCNSRIPEHSFEINFANMTDRQVFNLIRAQTSPLKGAFLETAEGRVRFNDYLSLAEVKVLRNQMRKQE